MLTDGEIHAYLANVVVAQGLRRQGKGKRLVEEAFARSGAERVDLYAGEGGDAFYQSFEHKPFPGYRNLSRAGSAVVARPVRLLCLSV
jgi:ribosomal protein S18 acetylase RimI-like enzyme